jgi:hypothetical protein
MDLFRAGSQTSVGRWKALFVALVLLSVTAMSIEFLSVVATFERGVEGIWGVKRDRVIHGGQAASGSDQTQHSRRVDSSISSDDIE